MTEREYIGADGRRHYRLWSGHCACGQTIINEFEWKLHLKVEKLGDEKTDEPQIVKPEGAE